MWSTKWGRWPTNDRSICQTIETDLSEEKLFNFTSTSNRSGSKLRGISNVTTYVRDWTATKQSNPDIDSSIEIAKQSDIWWLHGQPFGSKNEETNQRAENVTIHWSKRESYFNGQPWCWKTHLATVLGMDGCLSGKSVLFLVIELKESMSASSWIL